MHVQGDLVDAPGIYALDHVARLYIAEQRHLALDVIGQGMLRTADDDVRLDSALLQFLHGVLGRLCLEFLGGV